MTSTSGPGLSLMTEYAGFAYFAEVPAVIWDIQRMGPSTGLPTRTSQGDILMAYYLGLLSSQPQRGRSCTNGSFGAPHHVAWSPSEP